MLTAQHYTFFLDFWEETPTTHQKYGNPRNLSRTNARERGEFTFKTGEREETILE